MKAKIDAVDGETSTPLTENEDDPGVTVSMFDYSVENHLTAIDMISKLCGEPENDASEISEIERLSSTVTFLREWRHFNYKPRIIRFTRETGSSQRNDVVAGINLPQFSAAAIPEESLFGSTSSLGSSSCCSKDFVMYVGGPVWALDWCPRVHQKSDSHIKSEFIAIAAHPPDSSYHKIGDPLTGRGCIQIWCVLNARVSEEQVPSLKKKPKQVRRNNETVNTSTEPKRPRGRPRKLPITEPPNDSDCNDQLVRALADEILEDSSKVPSLGGFSKKNEVVKYTSIQPKKPRGRPKKQPVTEPLNDLDCSNQSVPAMDGPFEENEVVRDASTEPKKPRGRPKKKLIVESLNDLDCNNQLHGQAIAVQFLEDSSKVSAMDGVSKMNEVVKDTSTEPKKPRGRLTKKPINEFLRDLDCNNQLVQALSVQIPEDLEVVKDASTQTKRPRGRKKKKPATETLNDLDCNEQLVQALSIQFPEDSTEAADMEGVSNSSHEYDVPKDHGTKRKGFTQGASASDLSPKNFVKRKKLKDKAWRGNDNDGNCLSLLTQNEDKESSVSNIRAHFSCGQDHMVSNDNVLNNESFGNSLVCNPVPKDYALPRLVLCLAHNGKVAWDVKWRPSSVYESKCKHRMGYLAVLLGNGSLEVWEVPFPRTVNFIYSSSHTEGTDPRFIKLEPVFRCSKLKCGDRESIPLTVEWSASFPYDYILAGCHDGTVAMWKFSAGGPCRDTRPLLRFSADTAPIRAVAWAPVENDPESANVIVTAGHGGLKFWDIRDPFRALWEVIPDRRMIYSLDWLPEPRCLVISFDDGGLKLLSLDKAAYDVPVTGNPFDGTQLQGLHSYYCSSFAIWSVQVSRRTGMVAYCCADGTTLRFQLTSKAVEKDPFRNRAPNFLCGSLTEEDSILTVNTPLPNIPFPMKKSNKDSGDTPPRSLRGISIEARAKNKKAKAQASSDQILTLCYGNDPESGNTVETPMSKRPPKAKSSSKKKGKHNQALVCIDEEEAAENMEKKENNGNDEIELLPPKVVAMHRVRWNMNKGSEKWLCFGGAAGIVRCQEIVMSDIDKKLFANR